MRRHIAIALMLIMAAGSVVANAQSSERRKDEEIIRSIMAATTEAFSNHDAKAWAEYCTPDAQLVTVRGESMKGVDQIVNGLAAIFQT